MKFGTKTEMETKKVEDRTGPTNKYRDIADQLIGYAVVPHHHHHQQQQQQQQQQPTTTTTTTTTTDIIT